jgi:hypothetical protein
MAIEAATIPVPGSAVAQKVAFTASSIQFVSDVELHGMG